MLLLKQPKGYYILGFLTALYIAVVLNLAMEAQIVLRAYFGLQGYEVTITYFLIQNAVSASAAIIADSLLVSVFELADAYENSSSCYRHGGVT